MRSLYSVGQPLYERASSLYPAPRRRTNTLLGMLRYELTVGPSVSVPLDRRLWLWREGFTSRADVLLDLSSETRDRFLSEYREGLTYGINGRWKEAVAS